MRLAWLVLAHRFPGQVVRLARRLASDGSSVLIHVDAKTKADVYDEIRDGLRDLANVTFVTRRRVNWGDPGHLLATLTGIEELLASGTPFDRFTLLTGQDYPVRSPSEIDSYFAAHPQDCFIQHFPLPREAGREYAGRIDRLGWAGDGGLQRYERWHFRLFGRQSAFPNSVLRLPVRRRLPGRLQPFGGSAYWSMSSAAAEYVHRFGRENPRVVRFFRTVAMPEEMYFQTVLLNSPLASHAVNDDLRYLEWHGHSPHPDVLTAADFDGIVRSEALFARKFDPEVDSAIVDLIDAHLDRS